MLLRRLLGLSALHFGVWAVSSIVAYGSDLDRVPTRSALASGASYLASWLRYPHDLLLRVLPLDLLQDFPQLAAVLVLANSLAWGIGLLVAYRLLSAARTKSNDSHPPLPRTG